MSMLLLASASSASSSASDPYVLTLSDLVAAHRFAALDHDLTVRTKQLIAHPRAALFVQQVKANITIIICLEKISLRPMWTLAV